MINSRFHTKMVIVTVLAGLVGCRNNEASHADNQFVSDMAQAMDQDIEQSLSDMQPMPEPDQSTVDKLGSRCHDLRKHRYDLSGHWYYLP